MLGFLVATDGQDLGGRSPVAAANLADDVVKTAKPRIASTKLKTPKWLHHVTLPRQDLAMCILLWSLDHRNPLH